MDLLTVLLLFLVACQQWTTEANTNYAGGRRIHIASTIAMCQAACISNAACNGFDWDERCWLSGSWSGAKGSPRGVTHYVLHRDCGGNKFDSVLCFISHKTIFSKVCKQYFYSVACILCKIRIIWMTLDSTIFDQKWFLYRSIRTFSLY